MTDPARQTSLVVRIAGFYTRAVETAAIVAMVMLVTVAAYQVFCRYVLNASLFWSEELMRYLMIWTAFLTAGIVYTRGGFLGMRALVDAAPQRGNAGRRYCWSARNPHISVGCSMVRV